MGHGSNLYRGQVVYDSVAASEAVPIRGLSLAQQRSCSFPSVSLRNAVVAAISKCFNRCRDDPDGNGERKHRRVDPRMKEDKAASRSANDQRGKHAHQSAPLFAG